MARPLRINYPGAFYHITSRGNERKAVFKSERDREKFLEYLGSATLRYDAVIHAYCLLDNHYHLLLETPFGNLPQIMRHINGAYTTYFNVKRNRSGHLFQGRYKSVLVDVDAYAQELSRYIHLNPVRANIVETPEEYKWSSYLDYLGLRKPPEWLARSFILGYFGSKISAAQKGYKKFVTGLIGERYDSPLDNVVSSTILGTCEFIDYIKENFLQDKKIVSDIPALKELSEKITVKDITTETDKAFEKEPGLARSIKIYLCQKHTGEKLKDIGILFGIGESGVSQASRRIVQRIEKDKGLKEKINKIEQRINVSRMKN